MPKFKVVGVGANTNRARTYQAINDGSSHVEAVPAVTLLLDTDAEKGWLPPPPGSLHIDYDG